MNDFLYFNEGFSLPLCRVLPTCRNYPTYTSNFADKKGFPYSTVKFSQHVYWLQLGTSYMPIPTEVRSRPGRRKKNYPPGSLISVIYTGVEI
jgi:hypothetical protein